MAQSACYHTVMTIATVTRHFVNLFYPLHCPACGQSIDPMNLTGVCSACAGRIRRNPRPYCTSCGRPVNHEGDTCAECGKTVFHFERAYSACLYEDTIKELVHTFKYGCGSSLVKFLSGLMVDFLKRNAEILEGVRAIAFVPLDNKRLRERGFNQSRALAREIGLAFGVGVVDALEKISFTKHQNELPREERLINLRGAFRARSGIGLKGNTILLVDDVMTTGTTLSECARALYSAGAKEVRCFTLARGI